MTKDNNSLLSMFDKENKKYIRKGTDVFRITYFNMFGISIPIRKEKINSISFLR